MLTDCLFLLTLGR